MWHYVLSRIWRKLHRDKEIDKKWRSEELLKLMGGQKRGLLYVGIVSSRVGTPPFLREPPPFLGTPPLSEANLKSYSPLSESHPNWCM